MLLPGRPSIIPILLSIGRATLKYYLLNLAYFAVEERFTCSDLVTSNQGRPNISNRTRVREQRHRFFSQSRTSLSMAMFIISPPYRFHPSGNDNLGPELSPACRFDAFSQIAFIQQLDTRSGSDILASYSSDRADRHQKF